MTSPWWVAIGGGFVAALVTSLAGWVTVSRQLKHDAEMRDRERGHDALMRARAHAYPLVVKSYLRTLEYVRCHEDAVHGARATDRVDEEWLAGAHVRHAAFAAEPVREALTAFESSVNEFSTQRTRVGAPAETTGAMPDPLQRQRNAVVDAARRVREVINVELRADRSPPIG